MTAHCDMPTCILVGEKVVELMCTEKKHFLGMTLGVSSNGQEKAILIWIIVYQKSLRVAEESTDII